MTETSPAPEPLATPEDPAPEAVRAVIEAVNAVIADAFALYVKTRNVHWHVSGSHFREYRALLDEQAGSILASIVSLAERVREIGGTTGRSVSHVSRLRTIEDDGLVPPSEMIRRLAEDNRRLAALQRKAREVADAARDAATTSLVEDTMGRTEERAWCLYEISRGDDRTSRGVHGEGTAR